MVIVVVDADRVTVAAIFCSGGKPTVTVYRSSSKAG
jgi:hypothetical protein